VAAEYGTFRESGIMGAGIDNLALWGRAKDRAGEIAERRNQNREWNSTPVREEHGAVQKRKEKGAIAVSRGAELSIGKRIAEQFRETGKKLSRDKRRKSGR